MLRVVFTDADRSRVRAASAPDPLWEITNSLDRLQTRRGRWAFAPWYRQTRGVLAEAGLGEAVRSVLVPLFPRASYFPDFLTPAEAVDGFDAGIEAILATPAERVTAEIRRLSCVRRTPAWARRLAEPGMREMLVDVLRAYHGRVIVPHEDAIRSAVDSDRAVRARGFLAGGVDGLLDSFRPMLRWNPPVLEADYPLEKTVWLTGKGILLIPSYFCWGYPVTLADAELPPTLIYPLAHSVPVPRQARRTPAAALLGPTRAAVLRATARGFTTGEIARLVGISDATASHHLTVLRDNGLVVSRRHGKAVLNTLAPLGAALLAPAGP